MNGTFLPNLFVLGAAKCGTTTVHRQLADFPEICMSDPKEPVFFECRYGRGLEYYRERYFAHWSGEPIIGESRHRNLYLPHVPRRIWSVNPDAKLLVFVRNPIERAYSDWWFHVVRGIEERSFDQAITAEAVRIKNGVSISSDAEVAEYCTTLGTDPRGPFTSYLDSGYYADQLERYLALFPSDQLRVYQFEQLAGSQWRLFTDIREFLGLDPLDRDLFRPRYENIARPPALSWRHLDRFLPWRRVRDSGGRLRHRIRRLLGTGRIPRSTRDWLREHYRPHNQKLSSLLGRDLSHWR